MFCKEVTPHYVWGIELELVLVVNSQSQLVGVMHPSPSHRLKFGSGHVSRDPVS